MSDTIGPCLPPHLQKKREGENNASEEKNASLTKSIGPALPPWLINEEESSSTSSLPEIVTKSDQDDERKKFVGSDVSCIGPVLPPWIKNSTKEDDNDSFGPALPPAQTVNIGPVIPSIQRTETEDDDSVIGPLPPSANDGRSMSIAEEIEKRSKKMKDRLMGREEPKKLEREEWMTELPPLLQGFGVGPRKFRAREKDDIGDRSVWTDTPADRERKSAQRKAEALATDEERLSMEAWAKRDAEITQKLSEQSKPELKESLMQMHEKERKRKAKEEEDSGEAKIRRPFDREIDLQTNRFDDAAKKRMIKKTQGLATRFSSGSTTAKFL